MSQEKAPLRLVKELEEQEPDQDELVEHDSKHDCGIPLSTSIETISSIGKYKLVSRLGSGGMASVYLAYFTGLKDFKKIVVIKHLHPHLSDKSAHVEMFLDEARLAARLDHPNIVQTYEVGEVDGNYFIAMEYLQGQTLGSLWKRCARKRIFFPYSLVALIFNDVLDGLSYAHEAKDYDESSLQIVHRDISPQNIFVTYSGVVKILDFGIAKANINLALTNSGQLKGKVGYMSPEQVLGNSIDQRSDIWSIGVVLWEFITGKRLFDRGNEVATWREILETDVPDPLAIRNDIPQQLIDVINMALEKDINRRYSSASEMKNDLEKYLSTLDSIPAKKNLSKFLKKNFPKREEAHRKNLERIFAEIDDSTSSITSLSLNSATPISNLSSTSSQSGLHTPPFSPISSIDEAGRRRRYIFYMLGLLVLILTGLFAGVIIMTKQSTPSPSELNPASEKTQVLDSKILVSVSSEPKGVEVIVEGRSIGHTPFDTKLRKREQPTLVAFIFRKEGYEDAIVFSRLDTFSVTLSAKLVPKVRNIVHEEKAPAIPESEESGTSSQLEGAKRPGKSHGNGAQEQARVRKSEKVSRGSPENTQENTKQQSKRYVPIFD